MEIVKNTKWFGSVKKALEPGTNSTLFRTQRLRIAMLSGLGGKGISIVSQLVALPLAITALGIDRFGIYAMMVALLNWVNMAGVMLAPGLTIQIVNANSNGDRESEARVFTTAFMFSLLVAMCMFTVLQVLFHSVGVLQLFGAAAQPYTDEVGFGLHILTLFVSLSMVLSIVEGAQAGYQKQFVNNLLGTFGSIISIIVIVTVVRQQPSIPNLIIAIYGAPLAARLLNALHLFWYQSHLLPWRGQFSMNMLRTMLATGSAFLLTLVGTFLYQNFSVYWVGRELGPAVAAQMSVMMLVLTLAGSILIVVTQPLWPAIQDAVKRDDLPWVRSAYRRILRNLVPYIALGTLALAVGGEYILGFWLNSEVRIELTTRVLWALYFFIVAWEHINYTVLMGLSRFWFASISFSFGALVMLVTSMILVQLIGIDGIFVALCLGPLSLSAWLFSIEVRRLLAQHSTAQQGDDRCPVP